jgi:twitching motility protein PilT
MARIDKILQLVKEADATDLHLASGSPPVIRKLGDLESTSHKPLSPKQVEGLLYEIISDEQIREFEKNGDLDVAYGAGDLGRFRINIFRREGGIGAAIRMIADSLLTLEELNIPEAVIETISKKSGLILVTGPTNSGKTTTLSAIVDYINRHFCKHIVTLEDPIEYVHRNINCLITQRQIGAHTRSFGQGLRAALREDPDVILVGEMRDTETISLALTASEVGLLVLGTLHTSSASQTVDRIIDVFPSDQQPQARVMLADSLQAVVSQQLLKRKDANGRIMACEIMTRTTAMSTLIRDGKTHQIPGMIQTGRKHGMRLLDDRLAAMIDSGLIDATEALRVANDPSRFYATVNGTSTKQTGRVSVMS